MSTATTTSPTQRKPELLGQTVVVIGGSGGIGFETARRARAEGADVILTGRNPERLQRAASELDALSTAAFDATDPAPLDRFFRDLPPKIDHVMVTAGRPHYGRLVDLDYEQARRALDEHLPARPVPGTAAGWSAPVHPARKGTAGCQNTPYMTYDPCRSPAPRATGPATAAMRRRSRRRGRARG